MSVRILLPVVAAAALATSLPLVPAKAGIQGRLEPASQPKGPAAPLRTVARKAAPVPDVGERKDRGYDVRARHAAALRALGEAVEDPYVEEIPQIAADAAAAGDTSTQASN